MQPLHTAISTTQTYNDVNCSKAVSYRVIWNKRLNASDIRHGVFAHATSDLRLFNERLTPRKFGFCNLHHANFQQADLRWADLRAANLAQARLEGCSLIGCKINAQTVEASGWRSETVDWWINQGAEWSETTIEATRWHTGIYLETKRRTQFNVSDTLPLLFADLGDILVAGQPPTLFIAGLNIHSTALTEEYSTLPHTPTTLSPYCGKWSLFISGSDRVVPSMNGRVDDQIVYASRVSF